MGESLALGSKDKKGAIEAFRTALKLEARPGRRVQQSRNAVICRRRINRCRSGVSASDGSRSAKDDMPVLARSCLGGTRAALRSAGNFGMIENMTRKTRFHCSLPSSNEPKKEGAADKLAASPDDVQALVEMGFVEMDGESWVMDGRQKRAD